MTSHQAFKRPVTFMNVVFNMFQHLVVLFRVEYAFRVILITTRFNQTFLMSHSVSIFLKINSTQGYQAKISLSIAALVELFLLVHRALISSVGLIEGLLYIYTGRLVRQVGIFPAQGVDCLVDVFFFHKQLLQRVIMTSESRQGEHQMVALCALQLYLSITQLQKHGFACPEVDGCIHVIEELG